MGLNHLAERLKLLQSELIPLTEEVLNSLSDEIANLNKIQLKETKFIDGTEFPLYTRVTVERKKQKGTYISPNGRWALLDYGDFYRSFIIKAENNKLIINSADSKADKILIMVQRDTGKADLVFGLSGENMKKLLTLMKPLFEERILNFLAQA